MTNPQLKISVVLFATLLVFSSCKKKSNSTSTTTSSNVPGTPSPTTTPTNTKLPTIATFSVSGITDSSAVSGGSVSSEGISIVTAVGICWDEQPSPTLLRSKTLEGAGIGSFTSEATNLKPNTTYYLRAYASNLEGTAYGNEVTFKTAKSTKWRTWSNGISSNQLIIDLVSAGTDLYALSNSAIYKSSNGNNNWMSLNIGSNSTINCLINMNGTLFAGTNGDGVFMSTNGGSSWSQVNTGLSDSYIFEMTVCNGNLFAVTGGLVFLSTNNGSSWTDITPTISFPLPGSITCVGNSVFIVDKNSGKIYMTQDNGAIWTPIPDLPQSANIIKLTSIDNELYVLTFSGFFRSSDQGANWTKLDGALGNYPAYRITKDGTTLYASNALGIFTSTDNGSSWTPVGTALPTGSDWRALRMHLGALYAGSSPGKSAVYRFDP